MLVTMTSPDTRRYDTDLLETLSQRVVLGDGAMGPQLQNSTTGAGAAGTKYIRLRSG